MLLLFANRRTGYVVLQDRHHPQVLRNVFVYFCSVPCSGELEFFHVLKYLVFFFKTHIQFVVSIHFGSYYNISQERELIMLSRVIA